MCVHSHVVTVDMKDKNSANFYNSVLHRHPVCYTDTLYVPDSSLHSKCWFLNHVCFVNLVCFRDISSNPGLETPSSRFYAKAITLNVLLLLCNISVPDHMYKKNYNHNNGRYLVNPG